MNIETLLYDEIETLYGNLRTLKPGSDEHKAVTDEVTKLMDRAIKINEVDNDCADKAEIRKNDMLIKQQQLAEDRKDRLIKNIIGGAGIVLPLLVTIWGTKVSLKFEEEGTFTTLMGRGFINKLLPKK